MRIRLALISIVTAILAATVTHPSESSGMVGGKGVGKHRLHGRHTCGLSVGTNGNPVSLQSSGHAHDVAMLVWADDLRKDADSIRQTLQSGYGHLGQEPMFKAALLGTHNGESLLFVRGADSYFCGASVVSICSFDIFRSQGGRWVKLDNDTDFGDRVFSYNSNAELPFLSGEPTIKEDSVVLSFNRKRNKFDVCSVPVRIAMKFVGARFVVPVQINDAIRLNFIIDSGADDVAIPADVVLTLVRTGTITSSDFLGEAIYVLADGSQFPSKRFNLKSLQVGSVTVHDVSASIAPVDGPLLLGRSFLDRFSSYSIDNSDHALVLQ